MAQNNYNLFTAPVCLTVYMSFLQSVRKFGGRFVRCLIANFYCESGFEEGLQKSPFINCVQLFPELGALASGN